jgi:hypothetical protein
MKRMLWLPFLCGLLVLAGEPDPAGPGHIDGDCLSSAR